MDGCGETFCPFCSSIPTSQCRGGGISRNGTFVKIKATIIALPQSHLMLIDSIQCTTSGQAPQSVRTFHIFSMYAALANKYIPTMYGCTQPTSL